MSDDPRGLPDVIAPLVADGVAVCYGVRLTPGRLVIDGEGRELFRRRPSGGKTSSEFVGLWARQADAAGAEAMTALTAIEDPAIEDSQR